MAIHTDIYTEIESEVLNNFHHISNIMNLPFAFGDDGSNPLMYVKDNERDSSISLIEVLLYNVNIRIVMY